LQWSFWSILWCHRWCKGEKGNPEVQVDFLGCLVWHNRKRDEAENSLCVSAASRINQLGQGYRKAKFMEDGNLAGGESLFK